MLKAVVLDQLSPKQTSGIIVEMMQGIKASKVKENVIATYSQVSSVESFLSSTLAFQCQNHMAVLKSQIPVNERITFSVQRVHASHTSKYRCAVISRRTEK